MTFDAALSLLAERRQIPLRDIYVIAEVGSTAHGISNPDMGEDFDCTAIWIPTLPQLIWPGTGDSWGGRESAMVRTRSDGERSGPGDIDINLYTLRHFAGLLLKGNPSVLAAVFSPSQHYPTSPQGETFRHMQLVTLAQMAASKAAGYAFLGYMDQQMERWRGERGQKNVSRPELVERYGFDTKYAGHILRLGYQGIEFLTTGAITMPMPEDQAAIIRCVRTGGFTEAEALAECDSIREMLQRTLKTTYLSEKPDVTGVGNTVVRIYTSHYAQYGRFID